MKRILTLIALFTLFINYAQIATPIINTSPPTCDESGTATITNYDPNLDYIFTPSGPAVSSGGIIISLVCGLTYTVTASNGTDTSDESEFSIGCILQTPPMPTISTTPPTCTVNGTATITNYSPTFTYIITPSGPTVNTGGQIIGLDCGVVYIVTAVSADDCMSNPSAPFIVGCALTPPDNPDVCVNTIGAFISNYSSDLLYFFIPTGPYVMANGLIMGMSTNINYNVYAANGGSCSSQVIFNPSIPNCNTITGTVKNDINNDGCDATDPVYQNVKLTINDGTNQGITFTGNDGVYYFFPQTGTFTVTPQFENPAYFNATPTNAVQTFTDNNNNVATHDFCITANGINPDLEVVLAPTFPARPGFDAHYKLVYKNKGNQTLSGSVVLNFDDTRLDFVSASTTPTSITTGLLSWDYVNLLPFENITIDIVLNVNSPMETPAVNIGDVLPFTATINPISGDVMPDDNVFNFNQIVVGAYDPNDITCLQGEEVSPDYIGEYLHYLIRFENTGNFTAENVVIEYFVNEEQYDLNTLQILNASHDMYARINNNRVEFIFENIQLEPSDESGGGHGGIIIKMKTINNLNIGDLVAKQANIYFDYNFPIETNEAETTFVTLSAGTNLIPDSFSVYPNPINDVLNIKTNSDMEKVELYDIQGRLLQTHINKTLETTINMDRYLTGTYFIKIYTSAGVGVQKVMKK